MDHKVFDSVNDIYVVIRIIYSSILTTVLGENKDTWTW